MPGLEVRCRGNEGSSTKLPVGIRHSGDGGPRRRALPAGSWLLHAAPASGRNILMIFHIACVKNFVYTTRIFPPYALFVVRLSHYLSFEWDLKQVKLSPGWSGGPRCSCCEAGF